MKKILSAMLCIISALTLCACVSVSQAAELVDEVKDAIEQVGPLPTATPKPTLPPKPTVTPKPTAKPTPTAKPSPSAEPSSGETAEESPSPTAEAKSGVSPSPSASITPTATAKPTATSTPKPTPAATPTPKPTPTATPAPTPNTTPTPTPAPTEEVVFTPYPEEMFAPKPGSIPYSPTPVPTPEPTPSPAPPVYTQSPSYATGLEVAQYALQYVGYPYKYGGADPDTGFDCSGLVYYVYSQFGYPLNRTASAQAGNGTHVDLDALEPGDVLCFYNGGSYIGHAGIYIGNGEYVHAQDSAHGVVVSELADRTCAVEARRILG